MRLEQSTLEEVHRAYLHNFHEPGIQDMNAEPDFSTPRLPELESPTDRSTRTPSEQTETERTMAELASFLRGMDTGSNDAWCRDPWSPYTESSVSSVTYPTVPAASKQSKFSSPLSMPPDSGEIATTICSRCLVNIGEQENTKAQEMTMFMSPEWENFRRIGLGIVRN
ncbi:MAG: hypothetical protein L6R39_004033 [Caloplaca ligustica]|nr:MAG: hypothetical protein L6R39_004033 [Caloplaca ligustica]